MEDVRPGFPFRLFLPMLQLVVCLVVLWPYWPRLRAELGSDIYGFEQSVIHGEQPSEKTEALPDAVPPAPAKANASDMRLSAPAAVNLPAGLIQLPYILAGSSRAEWVPNGMWYGEWRAISWPFIGLVFWWIAGRGLEALLAARQHLIRPGLHWAEVTTGVLLFIGGAVVCVGLSLDRNPIGVPADTLLAVGGALWSILGAVIVTARILQWGLRRMARQQGVAYVP